jgi:AcrR family transcriptional regulator
MVAAAIKNDTDVLSSGSKKNPYGSSKQHILQAAETLFSEKGFSQTTLRSVAQASGANTALVSYYFGSKEGLQKAVVELQVQRCEQFLATLKAPGQPDWNRDVFRSQIESVFNFVQSDPALYRLWNWASSERTEAGYKSAHAVLKPLEAHCAKAIGILIPSLSELEVQARSITMRSLLMRYNEMCWGPDTSNGGKSDPVLSEVRELFLNKIFIALVS